MVRHPHGADYPHLRFRFVFDAQGGGCGGFLRDRFVALSSFLCVADLVLLALKAELGPRMTLLCEERFGQTSSDWLRSAEDPRIGIDIGQKQIRQMHEQGQLFDPASKPQRTDVEWWSRAWLDEGEEARHSEEEAVPDSLDFFGAEFTGPPPSNATLRLVHSELVRYARNADRPRKISATRSGISL